MSRVILLYILIGKTKEKEGKWHTDYAISNAFYGNGKDNKSGFDVIFKNTKDSKDKKRFSIMF